MMINKFYACLILSLTFLVSAVSFADCCGDCERGCPCGDEPKLTLMPCCPPLMRPFAADPRQVTYSVGWRFGDQLFNPHTAPVSFGNYFIAFRLRNPFGYCGVMDAGIEGGVWALFEHCDKIAPLDNADYYVGIPVTYCTGAWKFRLRLWHLSSHLGDEFMVEHPGFVRTNPSSERLDYFISYEPDPCLRLYGGIGVILRSDPTFQCKKFYAEYGGEYRFKFWNTCYRASSIIGRPFVAAYFRSHEDYDYDFDGTVAFGYEWTKRCGDCKRVRLFGEYHNGFSVEGQFCRLRTDYFAIRLSYGY